MGLVLRARTRYETQVHADPVRVALFSTMNEVGIVEYPEDKKVGIWAGDSHYELDHPNS